MIKVEIKGDGKETPEFYAMQAENEARRLAEKAEREARLKAVADLKQAIVNSPSGTVKNSDLKILFEALEI